jgi:PAS domain S-box-containing protein
MKAGPRAGETPVPPARQRPSEGGAAASAREEAVLGALRERERELATLMSNLPGMVYRCANERNWTMKFVSAGARALTGYAAEDLLGNARVSYAELIHPDDRERIWEEVQRAVAAGRTFVLDYRIRTASGTERWVWERGCGVKDEAGAVIALEGFITDITDRKAAEARLAEQVRELQRWHDATLGREGRILELKREINELLKKAGEPIRYPTADLDATEAAAEDRPAPQSLSRS